MAQVDVTELLSDPDFVDEMQIVRRKPTVSEFGENVLVESVVQTIGSIQPVSGKELQRLPDALRVMNVASFWVKGEIVSDGTCKYPDLLVFKGKRYAVQIINDWTHFGQGWSQGLAVREVIAV